MDCQTLFREVVKTGKQRNPSMTQLDVSLSLGIDPSHLRRLINGKRGKRGPCLEILRKIKKEFPELKGSVEEYMTGGGNV